MGVEPVGKPAGQIGATPTFESVAHGRFVVEIWEEADADRVAGDELEPGEVLEAARRVAAPLDCAKAADVCPVDGDATAAGLVEA